MAISKRKLWLLCCVCVLVIIICIAGIVWSFIDSSKNAGEFGKTYVSAFIHDDVNYGSGYFSIRGPGEKYYFTDITGNQFVFSNVDYYVLDTSQSQQDINILVVLIHTFLIAFLFFVLLGVSKLVYYLFGIIKRYKDRKEIPWIP